MTNDGSRRLPGDMPDWELLARYAVGECPPDEEAAVRRWLDANPSEAAAFAALERASKRLTLVPARDLDVEAALRKVSARIQQPDIRPLSSPARSASRRRPGWPMAIAGLAAAAGIAAFIVYAVLPRAGTGGGTPTNSAPRVYATAVGRRDSVVLSDGSRVVLGPASRLTVPANYGTASRAVELRGVAFFDVVHDATRPFSVTDAGALVTDLGTRFSVQDDADGTVHVAVAQGSVSLRAVGSSATPTVTLAVGDRATLDPAGKTQTFRGGADKNDLAWMNGQLVFRDAPLSHVASELRRWYGIELVADSTLTNKPVTHVAAAGDSGQQVVKVIAIILGAQAEQRGDTVILHAARPRAAPQ